MVKISFYLRVKDLSTINRICCEGCLRQYLFKIIFKDIVFIFYVNKCVTCISIYMCIVEISNGHESQKISGPLELGLQLGAIVWILGTDLGFSTRGASDINHWPSL